MTGSVRRVIHQSWVLFTVICLLIVTLLLVLGVGLKQIHDNEVSNAKRDKDLACIADWANAFEARAERINKFNDEYNAALTALTDTIPFRDPALFAKRLKEFRAVTVKRDNALKTNPLPAAPQFACAVGHLASAAVVITLTPAPAPPVTQTQTSVRTATRTTTASPSATPAPQAPGNTTTITATRTAQATRTVTRTQPARTRTVTVTPRPTICVIPHLCVTLPDGGRR